MNWRNLIEEKEEEIKESLSEMFAESITQDAEGMSTDLNLYIEYTGEIFTCEESEGNESVFRNPTKFLARKKFYNLESFLLDDVWQYNARQFAEEKESFVYEYADEFVEETWDEILDRLQKEEVYAACMG